MEGLLERKTWIDRTWNIVGPDVNDNCSWFNPVTLDELGFPNSRDENISPSNLVETNVP